MLLGFGPPLIFWWGSIPGLGRPPGEGKGYSLQYSSLENSMDRIVHGVAKTQRRLSDFHLLFEHLTLSGMRKWIQEGNLLGDRDLGWDSLCLKRQRTWWWGNFPSRVNGIYESPEGDGKKPFMHKETERRLTLVREEKGGPGFCYIWRILIILLKAKRSPQIV